MYVLNNATTQDSYVAANRLGCRGAIRFNITVSNAAVYLKPTPRSGAGVGGGGPEIFLVPGFHSRGWAVDQLDVRSAATGVPASVTIEAVEPADDGPG